GPVARFICFRACRKARARISWKKQFAITCSLFRATHSALATRTSVLATRHPTRLSIGELKFLTAWRASSLVNGRTRVRLTVATGATQLSSSDSPASSVTEVGLTGLANASE